jgi:hypothetical protein
MFGGEDDELGGLDREKGGAGGKGKAVGVLERRANVTVVSGEVVVGRDAKGPVKVSWSCAVDRLIGGNAILTPGDFFWTV